MKAWGQCEWPECKNATAGEAVLCSHHAGWDLDD